MGRKAARDRTAAGEGAPKSPLVNHTQTTGTWTDVLALITIEVNATTVADVPSDVTSWLIRTGPDAAALDNYANTTATLDQPLLGAAQASYSVYLATAFKTTPAVASSSESSSAPMPTSANSSSPIQTVLSPSLTPAANSSLTDSSSTNSSSPTASFSNKGASGVSGGAAAGIGIACAVIGAALAAAILWFLLGRRRPRRQPSVHQSEPRSYGDKTTPMVTEIPLRAVTSSSNVAAILGASLPQPVEDRTITGDMSKLQTAIKNHALSYYHARPLDPVREHAHLRDQAVQAAIVELLPLPPAHINKLLIDTTTRIATVRFCIAWTIFAGLGIDSDAESTFLPPELVQCAQALSSSGNTQTGKAAKSQGQAYNIDADDTADGPISFQTWRAITATLGKHTYGQLSDESDDARSANIHHAVESLNTILRPFADLRHNDRARLDNLAELLRRAARFGFMLFSQPSLWEFDWGLEREMRQDRLVVFPALVQIDESGGNASARSRKLTEREVCGLEGR